MVTKLNVVTYKIYEKKIINICSLNLMKFEQIFKFDSICKDSMKYRCEDHEYFLSNRIKKGE